MPRKKDPMTSVIEAEICAALWYLEQREYATKTVPDTAFSIRRDLFPILGLSDFPRFNRVLTAMINEMYRVDRAGYEKVRLSPQYTRGDWLWRGRGSNLYELANFYSKRSYHGYIPSSWEEIAFGEAANRKNLPHTEWEVLAPQRPETFRPEQLAFPKCYSKFASNTYECRECLLSPECRTATVRMVASWR